MKSREERESPEETTTGCSGVLTATGYRRIRRRIIRLVFVRFGFTERSDRSRVCVYTSDGLGRDSRVLVLLRRLVVGRLVVGRRFGRRRGVSRNVAARPR